MGTRDTRIWLCLALLIPGAALAVDADGDGLDDDWETQWFAQITNKNGRCKFYNATCGCSSVTCQWRHQCFICGQNHAAALHHYTNEIHPFA